MPRRRHTHPSTTLLGYTLICQEEDIPIQALHYWTTLGCAKKKTYPSKHYTTGLHFDMPRRRHTHPSTTLLGYTLICQEEDIPIQALHYWATLGCAKKKTYPSKHYTTGLHLAVPRRRHTHPSTWYTMFRPPLAHTDTGHRQHSHCSWSSRHCTGRGCSHFLWNL